MMDRDSVAALNYRKVVPIHKKNLNATAAVSIVAGLVWVLMAVAALQAGGLGQLVILPVSVALAAAFLTFGGWALKRAANDEPALIIDEVGIYDNASLARTGRVKWTKIERVWMMGPSRLKHLCIRPENTSEYLENHEEARHWLMKIQNAAFNAPIVIPMFIIDLPPEDIWHRIMEIAGPKDNRGTFTEALKADA